MSFFLEDFFFRGVFFRGVFFLGVWGLPVTRGPISGDFASCGTPRDSPNWGDSPSRGDLRGRESTDWG